MFNARTAMNAAAYGISAAALAFGLASNADAQSLQPSQCLPRAEMLEVLKKDQQSVLITGNRTLSANNNANLFTSNPDGSLGYNVEGDAPTGSPSKTICVRAAYTNVRLNTVDNPIVPAWYPKITNNNLDLAKMYKNGGRILMLADTFTTRTDGMKQLGARMSVSTLPSGAGSIDSISPTGAAQDVAILKSTQMTEFGKTMAIAQLPSGPVAALALSPTPTR